MNCVYENKKNILIFTGGKSPSTKKILSTLKNFKIDINSSFVICADSGLEIAQNCGIKVDFLLGDMDSIDKSLFSKIDDDICQKKSSGFVKVFLIIILNYFSKYSKIYL